MQFLRVCPTQPLSQGKGTSLLTLVVDGWRRLLVVLFRLSQTFRRASSSCLLDRDNIEVVSGEGKIESQKKIAGDEIDPEIKANVMDLAEGCKTVVEVIRKVKAHLKEAKQPELLGKYSEAITRLKESKEILS